ncbi:uncharacterized protein [Panulirus ornatus]|uniref:uncharacterized protein isoform X7 n=1 Tax=Panulirus ornatus TaxID=150431 RepID=UPI003A895F63
MPVKNAPSATWYKIPPTHPPASPRLPSASKVTSHAHPPHHASPQQPHPARPVHPQHLLRHGSHPLSQIPGSRSPTSLSGRASPLLPSKLPTSTSSSPASSPKRTVPQTSKIASPTRLRNADRLPPISKGTTSPVVEKNAASTLRKMSGLKAKLKDGKVIKEKTNENRMRGSGHDAPSKRENRDVVKKGRTDGERNRENEGVRKKSADTKADTKAIPKRKKSERSNSDAEIKPKKMTIKEHLSSSAKVEELQERTGSARLPKGRPQDRGPKPVKDPRRPTHLRVSQPDMHPSRAESVRSVVRQLREMDLGGAAEDIGVDDVDLTGNVSSDKLLIDGRDSMVDKEQPGSAKPAFEAVKSPTEDRRLEKCEEMEEGDETDGRWAIHEATMVADLFTCPGESIQDDWEEGGLRKHNASCEAEKGSEDCKLYGDVEGGDVFPWDGSMDTSSSLAAATGLSGGVVVLDNDVVQHVVNRDDVTGDSHVMKDDESAVVDSHVVKDESAMDASVVMKDGCAVDDSSHVMRDESAADDSQIVKDESAMDDSVVMKDGCAADDLHVMKDESAMDVSVVMQDVCAADDTHVLKDEPTMADSHVVRDEHGADDSENAKEGERVVSEVRSINEEDGRTIIEGRVIDVGPPLDGTKTENKISGGKVSRDDDEQHPAEGRAMSVLAAEVEKEEGDMNKNLYLEGECKMEGEEEPQVQLELEGRKPIPPEVNGNDNDYLEGGANKVTKANGDKDETKKTKEEEEEITRVNERRIKRKMETERTRGGTKKPARLFVDKGSTASGGAGSRGSRDSRVLSTNRANITAGEKKRPEPTAPPRRPRLDNVKSTIPKPGRLPPRKLTDPVKAARPGGPTSGPRGPHVGHNGPGQQHPVPHADQLRRLEAEVAARAAELKAARAERDQFGRGVEALTILIHHLTNTYDPFTTPRLKAEVVRLNTLLTETRLSLDESSAAVRRLQEAEAASTEQHKQKVLQLEEQHRQTLEQLTKQHQHEMDLAFEKHRKEMSQFAEDQQTQREALSRAHSAEVEQLEGEWRNKLDVQHEKHLCAVQELNTQHTHKLRELESSRRAREHELQEANFRLLQDQEALKIQSKKLEETLLNDTDHRLQAVRKMCSSLKSEVDSLKTVVEMKNAEIHDLRGQVVEMERLSSELEAARDRAKALQAKTEDLQAQMEKKALQERHLVNEHRLLVEIYQKESNANKRLSLENEELAWKLRQREEIMSTSMPSSTLDLVSRSPATPRRQEGAPSPQAAPRSPRVAVRSPSGKISPSKCDISKRRSRLGLTSEDGVDGDSRVQELSFESPPPSPCVKAVVEKSNSVSFILDLNDSQSDDSFLDLPPSPRPRPQRTVSLSAADRPRTPTHVRRVIHNNRANSLNRNGLHVDVKPKDMNGKPKEVNGKAKEVNEKPKEVNGKSLDTSGQGSRPGSRRTTSESSEGGSEMERVSPTGLAWTVPVHQPKSPVKINASRQNGSPVRDRIEHHLLEDPDEDEYEETPSSTHHFVEVVELSGVGLTSSSEAASDSELSQCDLKGGSSTDSDSDSSDGERHAKQDSSGNQPLGRKNGPWCPKEGAGEAMITDELLKQYTGDPDELLKQYTSDALTVEPLPGRGKRPPRRRLPSAPSSDSDDNNINPHNDGNNMDVSWSEDVDITSSSEMHEL